MNLERKLIENGLDASQIQTVMNTIRELEIPITQPWMPIQDSIDLAEFLAQTTKNHSRYTPGHQIVGGDIDIAVITRHDKFKWIKRKHYYSQDLNPQHM